MQQTERPTPLKVITMLDKLNNARRLYEKAADTKTRHRADRTFADCYCWFIQQDIPIEYDKELHFWLLQVGRDH